MLLSLATTHQPASDLGYLLFKNPARVHSVDLSFGTAHVFYPEAREERCVACLKVDVDPVALVRGRGARKFDYVNDRPYVASSFMSVAIGRMFGTAMDGRSRERPELAQSPLPLEALLDVVQCRPGEQFMRDLFEPLGYTVEAVRHEGPGDYYSLKVTRTCLLRDLLEQLYVLIPVLDNEKHYWVGDDEVEKLLRRGGAWLVSHPHREVIVHRYLRRQRSLRRAALARLLEVSEETTGVADETEMDEEADLDDAVAPEEVAVRAPSLHMLRLTAAVKAVKHQGAARVLDLGCGEGRLISLLLKESSFTEVVGVEVSTTILDRAVRRLRLDRLPPRQAARVRLLLGSLTYRDRRLEGFDAAAVVEVIEHLDPSRLPTFESALFQYARPGCVVVTTPNADYNVRYETLAEGALRHEDHRFEWTRDEFAAWCAGVSRRFGYEYRIEPIGEVDAEVGASSQMAVFTR
jgi:3' terminal RNA ribose 2'-O-methyltransferase Hen1